MFIIRPYREQDSVGCGQCFYEGFFTCLINANDRIFLRDYARVLIEKCSFAYVAESPDHQIVGFISGNYDKKFRLRQTNSDHCKRHYGANTVKLMTNTLASWEFYEKRGFTKTAEKLFPDGSGHKTIIYEYHVNR